MRKIIGSVLAILLISLAAVYLFIPNQMSIKGRQMVYQPTSSVNRGMMQVTKWEEWLPKDIELTIKSSLVSTIETELKLDGIGVPVELSIMSGEKNSSIISFETYMDNSQWSPIAKVQYFFFAKKIENKMHLVIEAASAYYNYSKGIYGFDIEETLVKDSSYIAIDQTSKDTPSLVQIYQMVDQLTAFVITQKGNTKGAPMVNITRLDDKEVYTQVAIPISRDIPVQGAFKIKKMVLGNLLSVKVQGDQTKVDAAFEATKQYIFDKQKSSPAMPFIIYNTNRLLEKDANRWISTINYPIY